MTDIVKASRVISPKVEIINNLEQLSEGNIIEVEGIQFAVSSITHPYQDFISIEVLRRDFSIATQSEKIVHKTYQARGLSGLMQGTLSEISSENYTPNPINECHKGLFEKYSMRLESLRFMNKKEPF